MRIIGFDPGYGRLGFGVIDVEKTRIRAIAHGVMTTAATTAAPERLRELADDLDRVLAKYHPEVAGVEILYFGKSSTTGLRVAEARGVILLACARAGLAVVEVRPSQVKMAVTGYGRAAKSQVQHMVTTLLRLPKAPHPDDAADALAIAWTAANCYHSPA